MAHAGTDDPAPGTPGWWRARAARDAEATGSGSGQPRRGRPPRSVERIVETAAELVDEVGTGTFSMRLLAERLGTGTATLYRHFAGKDELMVFVVDQLFAEAGAAAAAAGAGGGEAGGRPPTWQDAARRASFGFRRLLARHPNVLPLLVTQVPIGPNVMAARERTVATLVGFGFSPRLAARAYTTIAHYVVGFAIQQHAPGAPGPEDAAALGDFYRALDPGRYPYTVAASDALTAVSLEEEFTEGLEFILDGIDRVLTTDRTREPPPG